MSLFIASGLDKTALKGSFQFKQFYDYMKKRKKKKRKVLCKNNLSVINKQYAMKVCYINQERTGCDNVSLTNTLVTGLHQRPHFAPSGCD